MRQEDLFKFIVERLKKLATDEEQKYHSKFFQTYLPIFKATIELNLHNADWFQEFLSDDYVKTVCLGQKTFKE